MTRTYSEELALINRFRTIAPVGVSDICESLGIPVQQAWLEDDISGMIEQPKKGKFKITVNMTDPPTRQRFTLAHELGHYIHHRHLIGDGVDDNRAYRSTAAGKYHNKAIGPNEEREANKFAANVLMPRPLVTKHLRGRTPNMTVAKDLAEKFNVSVHAMCIRLGIQYLT